MHSQIVVNPRFHGGPKLASGTSFDSQNRSGGTSFDGGPIFSLKVLKKEYDISYG